MSGLLQRKLQSWNCIHRMKKLTLSKRVSLHKLDSYLILKFTAFWWDLPPPSYWSFPPPLPLRPQTRWVRSIKPWKLWSMVRLLGKSMQNMSETSLKSAYTTPWVKSTVAWHCCLISSKMKWSFPEEWPCYTLAIPMSGFLTLSDLKTKQL